MDIASEGLRSQYWTYALSHNFIMNSMLHKSRHHDAETFDTSLEKMFWGHNTL
jgi:hypothetical protein